jgi:hypothetical protein
LVWTGHTYINYFSDSTSPSLWDDGNGNFLAGAPVLPVGQGFFLNPAASTTNTFVGTVAVNVGATNGTTYQGGVQYLVSSVIPYGGVVTNASTPTAAGYTGDGFALSSNNGLPDGSEILIWTGHTYVNYFSDSTSPSLWDDGNGNFLSTAPSIAVGQGFFINPATTFTWSQGLTH